MRKALTLFRSREVLPLSLLLALSAALFLGVALTPGYPGDTAHYKFWTKLVTEKGIHSAYSGTYPETYAIYPPVTLYFYKAIGHFYQTFYDPSFDRGRALANQNLTFLIKLPGILFHLATALVIFLETRGRVRRGIAYITTAAYAFNPGVLFDTAYWGQPDAVHSLFTLLAIAFLARGHIAPSWVFMALALLTKPQTWPLLALLLFVTARRFGLSGLLRGGLSGLATGALVLSPFILHGTLYELATLPLSIADVMPFISVNAHNLWWLLSRGHLPFIPDMGLIRGIISFRTSGLLLLAGLGVIAAARSNGSRSRESLYLVFAFLGFSFFMVSTRMHENHAFLVLPLLATILYLDWRLKLIFSLLSLTFLVNMVLHDPVLAPQIEALFSAARMTQGQVLNSLINTLLLVFWVYALFPLTKEAPITAKASQEEMQQPLAKA